MATNEQVARLKRDVPVALLDSLFPGGDTDMKRLIDEHGGNHFLSVAHVYDLLAIKASEKGGSIAVGRYRENFGEQSERYTAIADLWRSKTAAPGFFGGTSKADKKLREEDTDRVQTSIRRGMDSVSEDTT